MFIWYTIYSVKQKAPRRVLLCLLQSLKDYLNDTLAEVIDTLPK
jgi:hypothetical protein